MRRPPPEKKKTGFSVPPLLIPIGAGLLVVALVAVVLVALSGGGKKADPGQSPSPSAGTPTAPTSSYQPPPNALQVGFGVSLVPAQGWAAVTWEKLGKQVAIYPPGTTPSPTAEGRAFFWVRQKQNVTANAYLLGIVEGETENEVAQLGNVRNLPCPKDVLVECVISYASTAKMNGEDVKVKGGFVEAYRRKDNIVAAARTPDPGKLRPEGRAGGRRDHEEVRDRQSVTDPQRFHRENNYESAVHQVHRRARRRHPLPAVVRVADSEHSRHRPRSGV